MLRAPHLAPLCAALLACGSDDGGDLGYPTCAPGEIAATGQLDDTLHVIKSSWKTYGFVNAFGGNGSFDADFTLSGEGRLHLEWPELVSNGSVVEARGTIETGDTTDALRVGNCLTGGEFTGTMTVDEDGDGGRFLLRDLRKPPYCGGSSVAGTLAGCFKNR